MKIDEIINFAREQIQPIQSPSGNVYRCSGCLKDGTYIPCIVLLNKEKRVELALRRFEESKSVNAITGMGYRSIVESFTTNGNIVSLHDLASLDRSGNAIPSERLMEIGGETSMSWTEFTVVMDDGVQFPFGTQFNFEFFEMPDGYSADRIQRICPHEIGKARFMPMQTNVKVYRERPFFSCYISNL